jgi:hypothetical protein
MTSISLTGVWLSPVSDPTDVLTLNRGVSVSDSAGVRGDFRPYAGGRVRLISRAGSVKSVQVSVMHADRTTREALDALTGVPLMLRDGRGRLVFGSYLSLEVEEQQGLPYCDLSFTLTEITIPVEV